MRFTKGNMAALAGVLAGAAFSLAVAQGQPAAPAAAPANPAPAAPAPVLNPPTVDPRPADAPPLVPIDVAKEQGDFRIAPHYVDDPAFIEKANVPKGRVIRFIMKSSDSKIYPTAPQQDGSTQAFDRIVAVYLPPGYVKGREIPFTVVQDLRWYLPEDAPMQPDGVNRRTDLPFIPTMLDNLIHEKRVPAQAAILLSPGPGRQRSIEYDVVSPRYTQFVETEVLPRIEKDYGVKFTKDPNGRATFGESSGAACALTMAWLHPELYTRVISYSGTFVALQRNDIAPDGAWDYHQTFIPNSPKKPLRIWFHVSERDNGYNTPADGKRNWVIANDRMAKVLKDKGYPYQYVFSEGVGHVSRAVQRQTMGQAFEWAWKGYKPK